MSLPIKANISKSADPTRVMTNHQPGTDLCLLDRKKMKKLKIDQTITPEDVLEMIMIKWSSDSNQEYVYPIAILDILKV